MARNGGYFPQFIYSFGILGLLSGCLGNPPGGREALSEILAQKAWRPGLLTQTSVICFDFLDGLVGESRRIHHRASLDPVPLLL